MVRTNLNSKRVSFNECSLVNSYDWLVNGTAQAQVETLMKEEHSFEEYTKVHLLILINNYIYCNVSVYNLFYATCLFCPMSYGYISASGPF